MDDLFGLTEYDVARLRSLLSAWESGRLNPPPATDPFQDVPPIETYLAKTTSVISAAVGSLAGSGTVHFWELQADGIHLEEVDTIDRTVYNQTGNAVDADMMVFLNRDAFSGEYFVIETGNISAPGTGCNVTVVSDVTCISNITTATKKTLSGYVLINGVHYPVCFSLA